MLRPTSTQLPERLFFAGVALLLGCSLQARAQSFQTIDVPGSIRGNTLATGINGLNEISGYFADANGWHGSVREAGGKFTTFDVPGAVGQTYAFGINTLGSVVGRAVLGNGQNVGFVRGPNGEITTFNVLGANVTQAFGINDWGQIVGTYQDATGVYHGFLRDPSGGIESINAPATSYTTARGINDWGQIVGYYQVNNGWRGFLLDPNGTMSTIDVNPPGSNSLETRITGVNFFGQIVGYTAGGNLPTYVGFLRDAGGQLTTIELPTATGPEGTQPFGINSWGLVTGYFTDLTGSHGFLAQP